MRRRAGLSVLVVSAVAAGLVIVPASPASATTITAHPVDFSAAEASSFNGAVATFEDDNPAASTSDFTATIDWGDGSPTTGGQIGQSSPAFVVLGTHTYADEGSFTVTVTISDVSPGTGTATATDTATVSEADSLSGTPVTFHPHAGSSFTGTVANFTDTDTSNTAGDFTATIDWGDAQTSAGTVAGGSGAFSISGTHTYPLPGTFTVTVTLSDDAPGTATHQVTSTAQVAGVAAHLAISFTPTNTIVANGTATTTVVATVTDASNLPVVGETVTFTTSGDVTFGTTTDHGDGTYTATVTASTTVGDQTITGHDGVITGQGTLHLVAGPAAVLVALSGGGQSTTVGSAFAAPLVIKVLDAQGHPVPGDGVTCTAPSSGPSATFSRTGTNAETDLSDSNGIATTSPLIANGIPGSYSIACTGSGTASFEMTNLASTSAAAPAVTSGAPTSAAAPVVTSAPRFTG